MVRETDAPALAPFAMPVASTLGTGLVAVGAGRPWLAIEGLVFTGLTSGLHDIFGMNPGYQPVDLVLLALVVAGLAGSLRYRGRRRGAIVAMVTGVQILLVATVGLWVAYETVVTVGSSPTLSYSPSIEAGYFVTVAGAGLFLLGGGVELALDEESRERTASAGAPVDR